MAIDPRKFNFEGDYPKRDSFEENTNFIKGEMASLMVAGVMATSKTPVKNPEPVKRKYIVAVDFDGTVVTHEYPKVGKDVKYATEVLRQIVTQDAKIILYTMRSGKELEAAINWFMNRGIPLYGINKNPDQFSWSESPKAYANLYIDDAALGCPLIFDETISKRPFVDWVAVDRLLQKHNWYINS